MKQLELATQEWLELVGFTSKTWPPSWEIDVGVDGDDFDGRISIRLDGSALVSPRGFPQGVTAIASTKDDVRRLCSVFGVKLSEPEHN